MREWPAGGRFSSTISTTTAWHLSELAVAVACHAAIAALLLPKNRGKTNRRLL
jgi:hypothetical protein